MTDALRGEPLVVRADAGPRLGAGHFMRCLALAQAWSDLGGSVSYVTATTVRPLLALLGREGFRTCRVARPHPDPGDASRTSRILKRLPGAWLVVDGYGFDEGYFGRVASGHPVLWIDDTSQLGHYPMDIVLNQNAHGPLLRYSIAPGTRLLLGTEYALLRREFRRRVWQSRGRRRQGNRILVTLGGSDPYNVTARVVDGLLQVSRPNLAATVILGPAYSRSKEIAALAKSGRGRIRLRKAVANMAATMEGVDLAISSGGTVVWELACAGVPTLVVETGPQEELLAKGLAHVGLFRTLGHARDMSPELLARTVESALRDTAWRSSMAKRGRELVDGKGCDRVLAALRSGDPS